jgi:hypothetical protein
MNNRWFVTLIFIFSLGFNGFAHNIFFVSTAFCGVDQNPVMVPAQNDNKPDIQWFKKEMKIDPKYTERHEGILGMSWMHFLAMSFLIVFFFGALITYYRRTSRTTRILEQLLKED